MENNAEEHRVLCIFLFPVISDACKDFSKGAAEVIMLLGYGVRAYTIESYAEPSWGLTRNEVIQLLYRKYSHLFGDFNCTYNLHGLSHAEEMHVLGQAHRFSAFRFEKSYAPYKKTFKYANHTHLRRAIEKALLYNAMQHSCRKNVIYGRETTRTNDTCVYVQEALEVITYKIKEINGSDCTCERQVIEPFMYDIVSEDLKLDFGNVGIYKFVEASTDLVTIRMSNISGKYIEVEGFIVLVPMELIEETQ